jgi:hypothetical protein
MTRLTDNELATLLNDLESERVERKKTWTDRDLKFQTKQNFVAAIILQAP